MPGPRTRRLTPAQISRLKAVKEHGDGRRSYSIVQLKLALDAPFRWETLERALCGKPVTEANCAWIVAWLDRFVPVATSAPQIDWKSRQAGEKEDPENGEGEKPENGETEATRTVRGSR